MNNRNIILSLSALLVAGFTGASYANHEEATKKDAEKQEVAKKEEKAKHDAKHDAKAEEKHDEKDAH